MKASFCVHWAQGEHKGGKKMAWGNIISETRYFKNMAHGYCLLWQKKADKSDWLQAIITGKGKQTLPVCL